MMTGRRSVTPTFRQRPARHKHHISDAEAVVTSAVTPAFRARSARQIGISRVIDANDAVTDHDVQPTIKTGYCSRSARQISRVSDENDAVIDAQRIKTGYRPRSAFPTYRVSDENDAVTDVQRTISTSYRSRSAFQETRLNDAVADNVTSGLRSRSAHFKSQVNGVDKELLNTPRLQPESTQVSFYVRDIRGTAMDGPDNVTQYENEVPRGRVTSSREGVTSSRTQIKTNAFCLRNLLQMAVYNKEGGQVLDISKKKLRRLPPALFVLYDLHTLDVSENPFRRLPHEFLRLQKLRHLSLVHCDLVGETCAALQS